VTIRLRSPVAAVIGHPIDHSLSPTLHRAGFDSLGVDWLYCAFDVEPGRAADAVAAMRTLGLAGLSVTMPHKDGVAAACDVLAPAAAALGTANTVAWDGERLVGHSTDGDGWVASMVDAGVALRDARVVVLGAGGAARSIVDAVYRAGARQVAVINRNADRAVAAAALARARGVVATFADIAAADVIVNATSVGMNSSATPFPTAELRPHHTVADIVYHPRRTALLAAASELGCVTVDGLGMLIHQAALQQQLWLGRRPDVAAMRSAVERELAARGG
jgi:shikimate dehydrogenase